MNLKNLNDDVRNIMLEIVENEEVYISNRLTEEGKLKYKDIFLNNIKNGNINTFADNIKPYILKFEPTNILKPKSKAIPYNAHITLCDGEFNKYYILGLCEYAKKNNIEKLFAYRAKEVSNPRIESKNLMGKEFEIDYIISDLRKKESYKSYFCNPNSGLSFMIKQ